MISRSSSGCPGTSREAGTPPSTDLPASSSITCAASRGTRMVNSLKKVSLRTSTPLTRPRARASATALAWLMRGDPRQARLAEQRHVDREGERTQARVGADIGGGLLAPDVLLACGKGEHEATTPIAVDRFAAQPTRHL